MALEHHAEAAVARLQVVDHAPVDTDFAGCRILEAGDHAQRRGLAAAGRADENDEFAVLDGETQILSPLSPRRKTSPDCTTRYAPRLSPYHAEAEAAREMLADNQADDHERNRDADRECRLSAVNAAFGRALIFGQFDRQCRDLGLGDDQR